MALKQLIEQISTTWNNISALDVEAKANSGNFQPWNNMNSDDFINSFNDLKEIISSAIEQNALENYPWNILNSLQSTLNTIYQRTQQFVGGPNQNTFQNTFQQIEALRTNLRSWGIYSYVKFGQNIETKIQGFDIEYQKIVSKSQEIEQLKESVENLIQPAVAGSLSQSFSERQDRLKSNRNTWFYVSILAGIASAIATILVVAKLINVFTLSFPDNATTEQIQEIINKQPSGSGIQLLRIAILLPFYYLFGIAFSQYKRERNLEEEYAHRSAVSTSLPNYGDLAGDPTVKDQIISSATQVIFTTPIDKKVRNTKSDKNSLSDLKDVVESIGNIVKPKE